MLRPLFPLTLILFIILAVLIFGAQIAGYPFPSSMLAFEQVPHDYRIHVIDLAHHLEITFDFLNEIAPLAWSTDGRLAFVGTNDSDSEDLYVTDGTTLTNVSQNSDAYEISPTWSVDGRLAFESRGRDGSHILVWDGSSLTDVSSFLLYSYDPQWSADGRLAFRSSAENHTDDIYIWDGTSVTNISQSPNVNESSPHWSPDGRLAFVTSDKPYQSNIAVWDGVSIIYITQNIDQVSENPVWSADGQLAFVTGIGEPLRQGVIMLWDGHSIMSISPPTEVSNAIPMWGPNGELAFLSFTNNISSLYIWKDGDLYRVAPTSTPSGTPSWGHDGRLVYVSSTGYGYDIVSWDGTTLSNIVTVPTSYDFAPALWTP